MGPCPEAGARGGSDGLEDVAEGVPGGLVEGGEVARDGAEHVAFGAGGAADFEFAEMAVSPSFRRRGLGAFLHDHLLTDVGRRCLLSTVDDPNDPAVRLYRRAGWQRLGVLKSGTQVMGRHAETPLLTLVRQDPT